MRIWVCLAVVVVVWGSSVGVSVADGSRSGVAVEPIRDTGTLADVDHAVVAYLMQRSGGVEAGRAQTRSAACDRAQRSARDTGATWCDDYSTGACFDCNEENDRWTCYVRWRCTSSTSASVCQ